MKNEQDLAIGLMDFLGLSEEERRVYQERGFVKFGARNSAQAVRSLIVTDSFVFHSREEKTEDGSVKTLGYLWDTGRYNVLPLHLSPENIDTHMLKIKYMLKIIKADRSHQYSVLPRDKNGFLIYFQRKPQPKNPHQLPNAA